MNATYINRALAEVKGHLMRRGETTVASAYLWVAMTTTEVATKLESVGPREVASMLLNVGDDAAALGLCMDPPLQWERKVATTANAAALEAVEAIPPTSRGRIMLRQTLLDCARLAAAVRAAPEDPPDGESHMSVCFKLMRRQLLATANELAKEEE